MERSDIFRALKIHRDGLVRMARGNLKLGKLARNVYVNVAHQFAMDWLRGDQELEEEKR